MDEILRNKIRAFRAEPTLPGLEEIVNLALRSGVETISFYNRDIHDIIHRNISPNLKASLLHNYLPNTLSQVTALYLFLMGQSHPWAQAQLISNLQVDDLQVSQGEARGPRLLLDFFLYLRALEPARGQLSRLLVIAFTQDSIDIDRNGWELDVPEIFTGGLKTLKKGNATNWRRLQGTLTRFSDRVFDFDLETDEPDDVIEKLSDDVNNGPMEELERVINIYQSAIQYLINLENPDNHQICYAAITALTENLSETGIVDFADTTIERIQLHIRKHLLPELVKIAALIP